MIKLKWLVAVAVCCLVIGSGPASACQYNVREVGFIDTGIEPYRLIVYLPESISASGVSDLKEAIAPTLADTNIRFEPVLAGADANQPALEFARAQGISRFPAAVLVSPDGQSLPVALSEKAASLAEAVSTAVQSILDSPTRREILEKCADSYGVVLLIEGPEPQANTMARQAISAALSQIGEQLESLPQTDQQAARACRARPQVAAREQMLLWTLGLKAEDVNQPHAAVFYGRGRWLGPVFKGEILTAGQPDAASLDHRRGLRVRPRPSVAPGHDAAGPLGRDPPAEGRAEHRFRSGESHDQSGNGLHRPSQHGRGGLSGRDRRRWGILRLSEVLVDYREIQVGGDSRARREDRRPRRLRTFLRASSRIVGQVLVGSLAGVVALAAVASFVIVLRARKQ